MNKVQAQIELDEHKLGLRNSKETVRDMPRGVIKDIWDVVLPVFEAQAEVMQSIVDAMD